MDKTTNRPPSKGHYARRVPLKTYALEVNLNILYFKEGDVHLVHAPELNLTGYGNTEAEARESFDHVIESYLDYGVKKKTLFQDLINHGWNVKITNTKKKSFVATQAPSIERQINENDKLRELMANPSTTFGSLPVSIPIKA